MNFHKMLIMVFLNMSLFFSLNQIQILFAQKTLYFQTFNIMTSWAAIKKIYRQLPYIVVKHYKINYLVPHKPIKPYPKYLQVFNQENLESKQYYDGNITPNQKNQQFSASFKENNISQLKKEYSLRYAQYLKQKKLYHQLYTRPLQIKSTSPNKIFRKQMREQALKRLGITDTRKYVNQISQYKLTKQWNSFSQQQKKVYFEKEHALKIANQQLIANFIQKHKIPVVKRCSTISRYVAKYFRDYFDKTGNNTLTPQFMSQYKALPKQQKQFFKQEASQIYQQSKLKYQLFLRRWNLNDNQLKEIIGVSEKYQILKRQHNLKIYKHQILDQSEDQQLTTITGE